jgi:undecaprenyl-diphosphatase
MNLINSIFLGIIEGLTEFLPISSTAHLILASNILKIDQNDFIKFFEIFIQSGAILSIIFLYFKYILKNKRLILPIIVSFFMTSLIALPFYKIIKNVFFEDIFLIIFSLIFIGLLMIIIENLIEKNKIKIFKNLENLTLNEAILIGIFQSLSIVPGVSRAGAVILGMLLLKYKRDEAVLYSFLLSVPTIISAGLFDLYKTGFDKIFLIKENLIYLITGFIFSFISALIVVKLFIKYLQNHNLKIFGYYRIILGIIIIVLIKIFNF